MGGQESVTCKKTGITDFSNWHVNLRSDSFVGNKLHSHLQLGIFNHDIPIYTIDKGILVGMKTNIFSVCFSPQRLQRLS